MAKSPRSPASTATLPETRPRQQFRKHLLAWYRQHGRALPWRVTDDPYHILVSEVMLQQTQVDRVLPKYEEWLGKYPSLAALADAPEEDVVRTWYPLGYNIRPRRLQTIAREAVTRYGGQLPSDEATLRSFKGIGAYTAGALLSFAFRQRAAILDTNVARVLFRVFVGEGDLKAHAMKRHLWDLSRAVLPRQEVFDFNQALMDFGALLCSARKPRCLVCPMQRMCAAYPFTPEERPAKAAKAGKALTAARPAKTAKGIKAVEAIEAVETLEKIAKPRTRGRAGAKIAHVQATLVEMAESATDARPVTYRRRKVAR